MEREIIFEKLYSKPVSLQFALHFQHVGPSTPVKSAEDGKIFKTASVTNLSAFSNNFFKVKIKLNIFNDTKKRNFFDRNTQNYVL